MKRFILILLIMVTITIQAEPQTAKYTKFKNEVIGLSSVIAMRYLPKSDYTYVTRNDLIIYLKVCTVLRYSKVIEKGYKLKKSAIDTTFMLWKDGLKRCMK